MGIPNLHTQYVFRFWSYPTLLFICMLVGSVWSASLAAQATCDNLIDGGSIIGDEIGCANPTFDPSLITSLQLPTGGSGTIEYLWMKTTGDPTAPLNNWDIIPGAHDPTYNPLPISETTYYARCSRRASCANYDGETDYITKTINCCASTTSINIPTANCTNEIQLSATTPTNIQYLWTTNNGTFDDPTSSTPTLFAPNGGVADITLQVSSTDGCAGLANASINVGGIAATASSTSPSCGETNGSITINTTAGTPPFQYDWGDAYPNAPSLTNLNGGIYIVIITDANGCSTTLTTELTSAEILDVGFQSFNASCNGLSDGYILLQPNNGQAPYTYQWEDNISSIASANNLVAGTYRITISDAASCSTILNISLFDPLPLATSITSTAACNGIGGQAMVLVQGGSTSYTYLWNDAANQTSATATNLASGDYTVTVFDAAGCTSTASTSITNTPLFFTSTTTPVGCAGGSNGSASIIVDNGVAPYTYTWSNGIQNQSTISNLTEGSYSVTVTDANGCSAESSMEVGADPSNILSISSSSTPVSCANSNGGSALVSINIGTAPYTYSWSNGIDGQDAIDSLIAGAYSITVTDANGCVAITTVDVGMDQSNSLSITGSSSPISCVGNNGSAMVSVSNGTAPYAYSWSNGISNQAAIANLIEGAYSVTVTDANGCMAMTTIDVSMDQSNLLSITGSSSPISCSGSNSGSAMVSVSSGIAPYSYSWSNGVVDQALIDNLIEGAYSVTVTDANGCVATTTIDVRIDESNPLSITGSSSPIGCSGSNSGSAMVSVSNGTAPYSYSWSNGESGNASISNLTEGIYMVTVTDAAGCSAAIDIAVDTEISFDIIVTTEPATCNEDNGRAVVNVTGPTLPYVYHWNDNNNQRTSEASNLIPAIYSVTVTNPSGCSIVKEAAITRVNSDFAVSIQSSTNTICLGDAMELSSTIVGEVVSYSWTTSSGNFQNSDSPNTSYIATEVGEHTISIIATDAAGCRASQSILVNVTNVASGEISADKTGICVGDNFQDIISVTLSGISVSSSNIFLITDEDENILGTQTSTEFDLESAEAGTCFIRAINYDPVSTSGIIIGNNISSIQGCFAFSNILKIDRYTGEDCKVLCTLQGGSISSTSIPVICVGDGTPDLIDAQVTGHTGALSTWVITDIHQTILGLPTVSPFDLEGTSSGICYIWHISSDRAITNLVVGGTLENLPGCAVLSSNSIEVTRNTTTPVEILPATTITCPNSTIELLTNWETTYQTFSWSATTGSFNDSSNDRPIYQATTPGTHTISVSIFDGVCTALASTTITVQEDIQVNPIVSNESCEGDQNGQISLTVSGGTAPYTYLWQDGATTNSLQNLVAGTYTVTVTDALDCFAITSITVTNNPLLTATVSAQNILCAGQNTGSISIEAIGGIAPYTYVWNGQASTASLANLEAGEYMIEVTDSLGCSVGLAVSLTEPEPLAISLITSDFTCQLSGSVSATVTGGTGNYSYQWNDAANSTTTTISDLEPDTYQVIVSDENGCTATASATIFHGGLTNCSINILQPIMTVGGSEGQLHAQVVGGKNHSFLWSTGSTEESIYNLSLGNYSLTVTDEHGCSCTATTQLSSPSKIGDFVFEDTNDNGLQDPYEEGLRGVAITLTGTSDDGHSINQSTETDKEGMYMFLVSSGTYKITLTDYLNLKISTPNAGDNSLDSDIDPITLMSEEFTILEGEYYSDLDIGLVPKGFCDNVLTGGNIEADEELCAPQGDPALIYSTVAPKGGSGEIEYLWLSSYKPDYTPGDPDWVEIPNSNEPNFDPDFINNATYYIRCTRRKGCDNYPGETNVVGKTFVLCGDMPNAEHLRVTPMEMEVMLEWTGNIPVPHSQFVIERSANGIQYKAIGSEKAHQSESFTAYDFMDKQPSMGENYYRIKTVHPTMGYTYSNIEMAMLKPTSNAKVMIYPNPTNDAVTVHFLEPREEQAILEIANGFGQVIERITIDATETQYQISLLNMPAGMYYLKFQNKTLKRFSQRILKQE